MRTRRAVEVLDQGRVDVERQLEPDQVRLFERPDSLDQRVGLSDRIRTTPGDIMKDDFPAGDVILISLILSSYSPDDYVGLLRRAYAKLPSGGAIVIHDFVMNDEKTGPTITALYNLTAIDGVPYSGADIAAMLAKAGFVDPQVKPVIPEYTGMVAARKL